MIRISQAIRKQQGFTLVEVIVTIMAAGVLAAFFVHFMGTAMSRASNSLERVQVETAGEATAEKIIAYYVRQMNLNPPNALSNMKASIDTTFDSSPQIEVTSAWITFDTNGNEISGTNSDTLKVTVDVDGNNYVFLLAQSRTADTATQPKIRY